MSTLTLDIEDSLTPEERAEMEQIYKEHGVSSNPWARYRFFREELYSIYFNINYSPSTEGDVTRLSLLDGLSWGGMERFELPC